MRLAVAVALVAATGCKQAAPAPTGCSDAIAKIVVAKLPPTQVEALRGALAARCRDDHWSEAMRTCVASATGQASLQKCAHDDLDAPAATRLQADLAQVLLGRQRPGANLHGSNVDVVTAYEKRIAEVEAKRDERGKALAAATTDADRAAVQAELDRLDREATELGKQLAQIKATHGGDLRDEKPSTVVPGAKP